MLQHPPCVFVLKFSVRHSTWVRQHSPLRQRSRLHTFVPFSLQVLFRSHPGEIVVSELVITSSSRHSGSLQRSCRRRRHGRAQPRRSASGATMGRTEKYPSCCASSLRGESSVLLPCCVQTGGIAFPLKRSRRGAWSSSARFAPGRRGCPLCGAVRAASCDPRGAGGVGPAQQGCRRGPRRPRCVDAVSVKVVR